jgi:hypothetical protein
MNSIRSAGTNWTVFNPNVQDTTKTRGRHGFATKNVQSTKNDGSCEDQSDDMAEQKFDFDRPGFNTDSILGVGLKAIQLIVNRESDHLSKQSQLR